jgi:hypothetical protein
MRTIAIVAAMAAGLWVLGCGGSSEAVRDGGGGEGGPAAKAELPWPPKEIADTIQDLSAPEWEIRGPAARKVSEAGRWMAPFLLVALKNPDPLNRMEVAYCLGRIGDPAAAPSLVEILKEVPLPSYDQIVFVAEALGALGDPAAREALAPLLKYAVEREVYGREVGPVELKMMDSREATVRQAAAEALARLGDGSGFPLLIEGLAGNGWVRRDAAVRLNRLTGGKVDFGFYLDMPKEGLDQVIASWNGWWAKNRATFKADWRETREAYDVYEPRKK